MSNFGYIKSDRLQEQGFTTPVILKGISRLAAESPLTDEKDDVQYFSLRAKSIINHCSNPSMPFQWTINPYRGCEYGCRYCYARYTHEFMEIRDPMDFEKKIFAKENASRLLQHELNPERLAGSSIAIGTATDPYQPAERGFQITRQILQTLSLARGISVSIVTKSDLIVRDIDLLREIGNHNQVRVSFSITTMDVRLARALEPRAPRPDRRFQALRKLVDQGIRTGVLMMPLLPGITTSERNLEPVIRQAETARAHFLYAGVVFLMPSAQAQFFPFVKRQFPHLYKKYRQAFARSAYLSNGYEKEVKAKVEELREKYGLVNVPDDMKLEGLSHDGIARQMALTLS